jgi:hypothetical protein
MSYSRSIAMIVLSHVSVIRRDYMREKEHFRDVVEDVINRTGKTMLGVNDIQRFLRVGRNKALSFLAGQKEISVYQFASKLL